MKLRLLTCSCAVSFDYDGKLPAVIGDAEPCARHPGRDALDIIAWSCAMGFAQQRAVDAGLSQDDVTVEADGDGVALRVARDVTLGGHGDYSLPWLPEDVRGDVASRIRADIEGMAVKA